MWSDIMKNVPVIPNIVDSFDIPEGWDYSVPKEIKLNYLNIPEKISFVFIEEESDNTVE